LTHRQRSGAAGRGRSPRRFCYWLRLADLISYEAKEIKMNRRDFVKFASIAPFSATGSVLEYEVREYEDSTEWYLDGLLHRHDGPAIEYKNGDKEWYKRGKLHRDDGPAYEHSLKEKWFCNGVLHRVDGPAYRDHMRDTWYFNGKQHREDGPAQIGVGIFKGEFHWYIHGKLHRVDGPALITMYGDRQWFLNGKMHRVGGPAVEWKDGRREWYLNGVLHRADGPAREFYSADGKTLLGEWWINGEKVRKVINTRSVTVRV